MATTTKNKWVCTDAGTKQYRKKLSKTVFEFKEQRLINPITKKTEKFTAEVDLQDYTPEEIIDYCSPYGYDSEEVTNWIKKGENLDLMAECIFEQLG